METGSGRFRASVGSDDLWRTSPRNFIGEDKSGLIVELMVVFMV